VGRMVIRSIRDGNRPPLVPGRKSDAALTALTRAVIAHGLTKIDGSQGNPARYAQRNWGDDPTLGLVLRAAVSPATLAGTPALAQVAVALLEALVPVSAGADLLARGLALRFDGAAQVSVPNIAVPVADFVGEGAPIPVVQAPTSADATLLPHKLAVITLLSGEMMRNTNAEALVRQVLIESTGPAIDKVLFSANPAAADRPAGLLNGIAALTPAAAGSAKGEILVDDLQKLAGAVAPVAGNGGVVIVASPDAAVALSLRLSERVSWPVLTSTSLAARTVIAVAANAVVSAVEGSPMIDSSTQSSVHRETVPAELVDVGGTLARPVASLFQMDEVALRLKWPISWALRTSGAVAWMQGVNW